MAANLDLDDKLIEAARRAGRHSTKKAAVTAALREYVHRRKARKVLELFGKVAYLDDYDYKSARQRPKRRSA